MPDALSLGCRAQPDLQDRLQLREQPVDLGVGADGDAEAVVPVIPASAERLIRTIDDGMSGGLGQPTPIFPRLELPEEEEEGAAA